MPNFDLPEYMARQAKAAAAIDSAGLDAMLLFAPESHYWLTGYDTFGFAMFQCMVMTAKGDIQLLTRMPDQRQAQLTSILRDDQIHVWPQYEGSNPAEHLANMLSDLGLAGARLGFESDTSGLTDHNGQLLRAALPGLEARHDLFRALRRVKSPAEIDMHRKAAKLSDNAMDAGLAKTCAGAFEGDILAAMQGAVFEGGGDYAGNEFILGSGPGALLCRYYSGRRYLDAQDQMTWEWAGAYARYHAAMMRTVVIGTPSDTHKAMHAASVEALEACEAAIKPGHPMGEVYTAHAQVFDKHGLGEARMQACGYA
ncbi:MAG: Xaa-Pro peptidase family protein, partial [Pseudomonadota bacterium]